MWKKTVLLTACVFSLCSCAEQFSALSETFLTLSNGNNNKTQFIKKQATYKIKKKGEKTDEEKALHDNLGYAVKNNNIAEAKKLLENGADPDNSRSRVSWGVVDSIAPLSYAVSQNNIDMVRLLLEYGANVNIRMKEDHNIPLAYASNVEMAQLLVEYGADINDIPMPEMHFMSCSDSNLVRLIFDNHSDVAKYLIENGAKVNLRTKRYCMTPLMAAVSSKENQAELVKLLIEKGADVNAKREDETVLDMTRYYEVEGILLAHGATSERKDKAEMLYIAARSENETAIQRLLDKGTDINIRNKESKTPLMRVINDGKTNGVRLLLEKGADVHIQDNKRRTALHYAALNKNPDIARLLLEKGAHVDTKDENNSTPLMYAITEDDYVEVVKLLIEKGADVNTKRNDGYTPLLWATFLGNVNPVQVLVQNGADINAVVKENGDELTALDIIEVTDNANELGRAMAKYKGIKVENSKKIKQILVAAKSKKTGTGAKYAAASKKRNDAVVGVVASAVSAIAEGMANSTHVKVDVISGLFGDGMGNICITAPNGVKYGEQSGGECSRSSTAIPKKAGTYRYDIMFHNGDHKTMYQSRARYYGSCSGTFSIDDNTSSVTLTFHKSGSTVDCKDVNVYKN